MDRNDKKDRTEAYPKPSETDQQLNNQPEYMDQEPNRWGKDISDVPETKSEQGNEQTRPAGGQA